MPKYRIDQAVEVRRTEIVKGRIVRLGKTVADVRLQSGRVDRFKLANIRDLPKREQLAVYETPEFLRKACKLVWASVLPKKRKRLTYWDKRRR